MTATTSTSPRTRRAMLAGVLGGVAAWAASTAARVSPAEAAAGDPIRMGRTNLAGGTSTTLQTDDSKPPSGRSSWAAVTRCELKPAVGGQ